MDWLMDRAESSRAAGRDTTARRCLVGQSSCTTAPVRAIKASGLGSDASLSVVIAVVSLAMSPTAKWDGMAKSTSFERVEMHLAKVMRQRVVVEMIYLPIVPR